MMSTFFSFWKSEKSAAKKRRGQTAKQNKQLGSRCIQCMPFPVYGLHTRCTADRPGGGRGGCSLSGCALCCLPAFCFPVCFISAEYQHNAAQYFCLKKYNKVDVFWPSITNFNNFILMGSTKTINKVQTKTKRWFVQCRGNCLDLQFHLKKNSSSMMA